MIYVIYNVETGELLQLSEQPLSVSGHPLQVKSLPFDYPVDLSRFQWHTNGLTFIPVETDERNITGVAYLRRFTQPERIAIREAAKASAQLDDYLKLLDATIAQGGVVDLNDADTVKAVNLIKQAGLLTAGRAAEIING